MEHSRVEHCKRVWPTGNPQLRLAFFKSYYCACDQVNADIKEWMVKEGAEMELTSLKTRGVGSAIVTKEVGFNRTRDITNEVRIIC